ncbi:hypothetical protein ACFZDK_51180 [Streptomyces sp. NPDC007901]|uniref:hypothetical protein n=1 Tax=Streptomyces sp. NPDC007901 TaxID=3364785 RepID=UPI0036F05083
MTGAIGLADPKPGNGPFSTLATMPADHRPAEVDQDVAIPLPEEGEVWTVGAVILNQHGEAFAQKRGPDRRLYRGTTTARSGTKPTISSRSTAT